MQTEIRIAGVGGQGLVSASVILAEALGVVADYEVVQTQFYASNITGGASSGDVIASDAKIDFPWILEPDLLVALAQDAVNNHAGKMRPCTKAVIDDLLVEDTSNFPDGVELLSAPLTRTADDIGVRKCANIVALGVVAKLTGLVDLDQMTRAVVSRAPGKPEINRKAVEAGYNLQF